MYTYPQSWTRINGAQATEMEKKGHTVYQRGDGYHHDQTTCRKCRKDDIYANTK